jgi:hypothetical protein
MKTILSVQLYARGLVRSSEEKGNLRGKGEGSEAKEQRGKALRQRTKEYCTPRKRRILKDKEKQLNVPELLRCGDLDNPLGCANLCTESWKIDLLPVVVHKDGASQRKQKLK